MTIFTVSDAVEQINEPLDRIVIGSWVSCDRAVKEAAGRMMERISRRPDLEEAVMMDDIHDTGKFFNKSGDLADCDGLRAFIEDTLTLEGCYHVCWTGTNWNVDVDCNDVEDAGGVNGMALWTLVKSGECDNGDPFWCRASADVFCTQDEAVKAMKENFADVWDYYAGGDVGREDMDLKWMENFIRHNGHVSYAFDDDRCVSYDLYKCPLHGNTRDLEFRAHGLKVLGEARAMSSEELKEARGKEDGIPSCND